MSRPTQFIWPYYCEGTSKNCSCSDLSVQFATVPVVCAAICILPVLYEKDDNSIEPSLKKNYLKPLCFIVQILKKMY